jgi:anti-sigma-K factor RskA
VSTAVPPSPDPREALLERAADVALYGGGFDAEELALAAKLGINLERECQALELAAAELAALEATRDLTPPPARLESKLSQLSEALHAPAPMAFPGSSQQRWIPAAAAGALIGVLGTLAVLIARDARSPQASDPVAFVRSHPNAVHWKWTGTQDAHVIGRVAGEAYFDPTTDEGLLEIEGLAPNDPSREQYQLWIFDADRDERYPVDGGVFDVSASGRVLIPVRAQLHVSRPVGFAVTVEPPGGVVVSARRIALLAKP